VRAATRVLPAVLLLLVPSVLAACDSEEGDPGGGYPAGGDLGGAGEGGEERLATSWTFDESQCASGYPIPLTVSTTVDSERDYVQNVVACTRDEQYGPVWLHNVGHEIWRFNSGAAESEFIEFTDESDVFAESFDNPAILVPDDVLVIHAPPRRVSWTLDKLYTIAWETQSEGIERLEDYGQDAVFLALKRKGSPARAALTACTLTAYDVAAEWRDDPDGFIENFGASLATGAGTVGCTTKWQSAWGERFKPTAQFLDDADTSFRLLSRLGRLAILIK
jgi:hypothetical protein